MKKLIITEKPSVAQQFASALGVTGKHNGYIENDSYLITWCVGHLVTMSYPEVYDPALKSWSLDTLPFLPKEYKYEVIKNVRSQFNVVKECLNRKDVGVIYNAGDSGREGEYIQRLVYRMAGWNRQAKMKRVWIDSQTDDAIRCGIRDAKDASEYDRLTDAAYMRAIEDYAIGINFSRALSCKFGYEFNHKIKSSQYKPLSVGRVMTCVLGMIVDREREIRNFKPTPFFRVDADASFPCHWKAVETSAFYQSPMLYDDSGFKRKEDAARLVAGFMQDKRLAVLHVQKKQEKKAAPLLFNLAELQNECSKRFKISPDKTLEVAQALYEGKLTTYPRTDARVLSSAVAVEIEKNIKGLQYMGHKTENAQEILQKGWYKDIKKSKYCDDKKITDHYAIIPTGQGSTSGLDELQTKVYQLIVERFLSIFYPPAEYEKIDAELIHASKERFFASEKNLTSPGYLVVTGYEEKEKNDALSTLQEKMILPAIFTVKDSQTSPPKRYTTGSLILAMENAGQLIEDEELRAQIKGSGIGTSATRAEIIKKLEKNGYITVNGKTQAVSSHPDGEALYDIVEENLPKLLSPKMTASWEKGLAQIENGEITKEQYRDTLYQYVADSIESIKSKQAAQQVPDESLGVIVADCPFCGGEIVTTRFGIGCSNYKTKGCRFALSKDMFDKMGNEQFAKLIAGEKTDLIGGLISKKGKTFSAVFFLEDGEVKMEFPGMESHAEAEETSLPCPRAKCKKEGKTLIRYGKMLKCSCGFSTFATVGGQNGKELSDSEMEQLLDGETIHVDGLLSKKGKRYSADVKMKRDGKLEMLF